MKFITSDGVELYYEKSGNGVPCVYLHGGPGYWSKSFQHYSREFLEENVEMIYLDQRGCGRSNHSLTQDYSLDRLLLDIEELRGFLGINDWYLIGHSFGGILAVNYANRYPERTKGIILSNATLNLFDSFRHQIIKGSDILGIEQPVPTANHLESFMEKFFAILTRLVEKEEYFKFQFVDLANKKNVDTIDKTLDSDPKFQQYVFSSEEYFQDFTSLTEQIDKAVLVIAGEFDDAIGPNHHNSFKFKQSQVLVLKSSHHPYIENQVEFNQAILHFVNSSY